MHRPNAATLGVDWMADVRNADGGWGFFAGTDTDPNSTAGVLQALVTLGVAGQQRFAGSTAATLAFQLGCAAPIADRGAFTYPGSDDAPNLFATVQAVPAVLWSPRRCPVADPVTPAAGRRLLHDDDHHHVDLDHEHHVDVHDQHHIDLVHHVDHRGGSIHHGAARAGERSERHQRRGRIDVDGGRFGQHFHLRVRAGAHRR